ncbi:2-hydroxyacid dehydrogenase [Paraburkholderia flava]|uniref:2-hydroxyacid dehydrogenase n=1 Tax=Paraburkholderia flava TaxID=2547393 RepID=UPI0010602ACE|nr:glyoxylate/hydroxypyruvate reductase A [Paraburkholderia flava]
MTRLLLLADFDLSALAGPLEEHLRPHVPGLRICLPGDPDAGGAEIAVCWNPPAGALSTLPKLRLVHSIAAGVDNILSDPTLPDVPLCRVVDPSHAQGMTEFATWGVLHFHRHFDAVLANQSKALWRRPAQTDAAQRRVGVMGLGTLGARVAVELQRFGFDVRGWSRERKSLPGIATFRADEFDAFCADLDIAICLLPLTEQTRGILGRATFDVLPRGAKLIHAGRGEHVVRADLLAALEDGRLGGAIVDVFDVEPLPADDAYWQAPNLIVTPHMASVASFECIGEQVAFNVRQLLEGGALRNVVDRGKGY